MASKHIQTILTKEQHERLVLLALKADTPLKEYLRQIVVDYLSKQGEYHAQKECNCN